MTRGQQFLSEIQDTVLIGDGAIGTELFARGAVREAGIERLNLLNPELVLQLHRDYVKAGSRVIETNTFGANRLNLARYGAGADVRDIVLAGANLARAAANSDVYIAGSVGPLPFVDGEPISRAESTACFTEQIAALVEGCVDLLILETFTSLDDILVAISIARSLTDIPIIAQMAFEPSGCTEDGVTAGEVAVRCHAAGADVVGANCGYGIPAITEAIKQMIPVGIPVSAYMNASFPEQVEGRLVYVSTPEYLANRALALAKLGVRLIGGCCGTNPDMLRAISLSVQSAGQIQPHISVKQPARQEDFATIAPEPTVPGPILVELDPPSTLDIAPVISAGKALKKAGASAITIADNPFASVRVDTLTVGSLLQRGSGLPVVLHLTGRDRNRIAIQSTLMGAHVQGIRSILCLTGDPVRMYEEPNTSGVFDLTSVGLVKLAADFNAGRRMGKECQTSFAIGVALNPNVRSFSGQISKLQRKIEAGAKFALTQPVFSDERLDAMLSALDEAGIDIPIYIGIFPLTSLHNADFLHNEVPGIVIPDDVRERIASFSSVADQRAAGQEIAVEFIRRSAPRVHGYYIITPRNKVNLVLPLIEAAKGSLPR